MAANVRVVWGAVSGKVSRPNGVARAFRKRTRVLTAAGALGFGVLGLSLAACSSTDSNASNDEAAQRAVAIHYAKIVRANYADSIAGAQRLATAVDAFVATPTDATLKAAREAWVAARPAYDETEAFRFYGGPIDGPEGREMRINAWPLDENYMDSTKAQPKGGLINDAASFPDLSTQTIAAQNQKGGEKNVTTGWHAIEFLLWGQDTSKTGPGERPASDFLEGGTLPNGARRGAYLKAIAQLLVEDLKFVAAQWDEASATSYGATFVRGNPSTALASILKGLGTLAGGEVARQRMNNAYETKDQEEETSCFSDTTTLDLLHDVLGIENVYLGRYGTLQGPGISSLVAAKDGSLDARVRADVASLKAAISAIPTPFDQTILAAEGSEERKKLKAAITSAKALTQSIGDVAKVLGVTINFE